MSSPGGGRRQTGRPWWKAVGERVPRQFGSRRTGKGNGRRTTDDRQDNRRPATDGRRQRPTADNRQPTGRPTTRRPTTTTNRTTDDKTTDDRRQHRINDRRQDDRRPNRRPTTRRVKNKHNPRTSIPSGGYRAIGPTGGITVSERRHTSPKVGHGEGVKASGVHPKRGRAVRKRFVLFCFLFCFLKEHHSYIHSWGRRRCFPPQLRAPEDCCKSIAFPPPTYAESSLQCNTTHHNTYFALLHSPPIFAVSTREPG